MTGLKMLSQSKFSQQGIRGHQEKDRFDRLAGGQKPVLEEMSSPLKGRSESAFLSIEPGV